MVTALNSAITAILSWWQVFGHTILLHASKLLKNSVPSFWVLFHPCLSNSCSSLRLTLYITSSRPINVLPFYLWTTIKGIIMSPPKIYWSISSQHLWVWLIFRNSVCRYNCKKKKVIRVSPNLIWLVSLQEEIHRRKKQRLTFATPSKESIAGVPFGHQKLREGHVGNSPLQTWRNCGPGEDLILDF